MPYFVFAEFGSPDVLAFLRRLRASFAGDSISSPVHVTLRGPYAEPPTVDELTEFASRLQGYGVKINGNGAFSTKKGFAVFLRAECSPFRQIWDKPDFKVPLARIEPHVTIYETTDREAARAVRDFLKREEILIHTYNVYLSVYESKARQGDFFGMPTATPRGERPNRDLWRVPEAFLERASTLGHQLAQNAA
jgi:hypothetical protein